MVGHVPYCLTSIPRLCVERNELPVIVDRFWIEDPRGPGVLGTSTPRMSWSLATERDGWMQSGYDLELRRGDGVERHTAEASEAQRVAWPFAPLTPYDRAETRVRVRGGGESSDWSSWHELITGPLAPEDWSAAFITAPHVPDYAVFRARRVIDVPGDVERVLVSATAHGAYELTVNGRVATADVLAPGHSVFSSRLVFQTYDVTALARSGENVIGFVVADGWYAEHFGFKGHHARRYPGPTAVIAQAALLRAGAPPVLLGTDETWSVAVGGPTTGASIYRGETYDARLEDTALVDPRVELPGAFPATIVDAALGRLAPATAPGVVRHESIAPVEVITSPSGRTIVDFGQNLVGWTRIELDAPAGTEVVLRHAEVLEHGELGVRPLRSAIQTDSYVSSGEGERIWAPRFTFHGFRYVQVDGWPGSLDPSALRAVVVHSDMQRRGTWHSDSPLLNRLHENVVWSMRGNFLSIPTDCPQRDERQGWTGDIQVFAPTASYLYDCVAFLEAWLREVEAEQDRFDGVVPPIVPAPTSGVSVPTAGWSDVTATLPLTLFDRFGDAEVVRRHYPHMVSWIDALERRLHGDLWTGGFQFGDWLDPAAPPDAPADAKADPDVVATAYAFRSLTAVGDAAELLGYDGDASRYHARADQVREAFRREFVAPSGRIVSDAQAVYALAISFGLLDEQERVGAGARLKALVVGHGYRIRTGFLGTPLVLDALTDTGNVDTAARMLQETGLPSWLWPVTRGATTIWERWDSMLPDGTINPGRMTSFNHYALGAVADWMQRVLGGIAPGDPGYRTVMVSPHPLPGVSACRATLDIGYGEVVVDWEVREGRVRLHVEVPPNARASVTLPGSGRRIEVGSGQHRWDEPFAAPSRAPLEEITLDTPLDRIVDDAEARAFVESAIERAGGAYGTDFSDLGRWRSDWTLGEGTLRLTPPAAETFRLALADYSIRSSHKEERVDR